MTKSIKNGLEKVKGFGMAELDERGMLLSSLKGYLEDLKESGVEELSFAAEAPAAADSPAPARPIAVSPVPATEAPVARRHAAAADAPVEAVGKADARLAFVMTGAGFGAPSGNLFALIVKAMGFAPEEVFLLTFPEDAAAGAALHDELLKRLAAVAPDVVVAMGEPAAQLLTGRSLSISQLRGRFMDLDGARLMATLHPDQLLADETLKRQVWNEMKQVMAFLSRNSRN